MPAGISTNPTLPQNRSGEENFQPERAVCDWLCQSRFATTASDEETLAEPVAHRCDYSAASSPMIVSPFSSCSVIGRTPRVLPEWIEIGMRTSVYAISAESMSVRSWLICFHEFDRFPVNRQRADAMEIDPHAGFPFGNVTGACHGGDDRFTTTLWHQLGNIHSLIEREGL